MVDVGSKKQIRNDNLSNAEEPTIDKSMKLKLINVLVTLSDVAAYKAGLLSLAALPGVTFIATTGTAKKMAELGITNVKTVAEVFGPEMLGHPTKGIKVKTLHAGVFASINTKRDNVEQMATLGVQGLPLIDMVISDPYNFEGQPCWANIDLGFAVLLAAAKNCKWVIAICHFKDLEFVVRLLSKGEGVVDVNRRLYFALQAFRFAGKQFSYVARWIEKLRGSEPDESVFDL